MVYENKKNEAAPNWYDCFNVLCKIEFVIVGSVLTELCFGLWVFPLWQDITTLLVFIRHTFFSTCIRFHVLCIPKLL